MLSSKPTDRGNTVEVLEEGRPRGSAMGCGIPIPHPIEGWEHRMEGRRAEQRCCCALRAQ